MRELFNVCKIFIDFILHFVQIVFIVDILGRLGSSFASVKVPLGFACIILSISQSIYLFIA